MNEKKLNTRTEKRKKRNKFWRIFWIVVGVFVVGLAGFAWYEYSSVKNAANTAYRSGGISSAENGSKNDVISNKKPMAVLLMGTDTGALGRVYKGRTDSIMVLVLNPRTKKSTIVSIERDFQVNFPQYPQYSPSKINAAYTYGGVKLLSQTLDRYFKIPVNTYALINMGGMKSIIDQLGGVDITPLLSFDYEGYSYKKGVTTHMNGDKALEYCRMRYDDPEGDYGRQKRQRQVLTAIIKSGADVQSLLKPAFLNSVSSQVRTDLTFSDLTQMAKSYRASGDQLETDYTHGTGFNQDGVSYQHISLAERQRISDLVRQAAGLKKVQLANGQ